MKTNTTKNETVKIYGKNHDMGGADIGPFIRNANDHQRTVKLLKECGYQTVVVE